MRKSRITICILIVCTMILSLFAAETFASETLKPDSPAKLTIQTQYGSTDPKPVEGIPYRIFRIAEIETGSRFFPTDEFKDCPVSLKGDTTEEWDGEAELIMGYAQAQKLEPAFTVSSGKDGLAVIDDIDTGLYLVIADKIHSGGYTYSVKPDIVSVPNIVDESWNYDVTMVPKMERFNKPGKPDTPTVPEKKTVDRKAIKIWEDEGFEEARPEEITVRLLRNGEVVSVQTLNGSNNWSCEWRGLDAVDPDGVEYEWNMIEDAAEHYSASMTQSGITFVLTNTYEEEIPEDPTPLAPADPGEPDEPLEELPEDPIPLAMLPQTGMLWWPVPIIAALGVMFLALGASFRRRENA